jgi:hypothetical protein
MALEDDVDDVAWALRTAGVQWNMGARNDAIEWLLRAVDTAIDAGHIERAREIQRTANDLSEALRSGFGVPPVARSPSGRPLSSSALRRASSLPPLPLPPPPGYQETEPATLDVDLDELEVEEESVEALSADSIEVLEPEILDEITAEDELTESDIEALSEASLEVDHASIRVEEPPAFTPSEPPTAQTESLPGLNVQLMEPAEVEDAPTLPPAPAVFPSLAASLASVGAAISGAPASQRSVTDPSSGRQIAISTVPDSRPPRREPWQPSPSFGDNLAPPASVVFRSASSAPAVEDGERVSDLPPEFVAEAPPTNLVDPSSPVSSGPSPATRSVPPAQIFGLKLSEIHGLEDLPDEAQQELARSVEIYLIDNEEEITGFGLALVLEGRVSVMPAVMDVVCLSAGRGELIFGEGHVGDGVALKVVASEDRTRVACWPIEQFAEAIAPCPWVRDELRRVGDKLQALVGAAMGPMGEKLDEQLRAMVLDRCSVKLLLPGEAAVQAGKPLPGMTIVGAGRLELLDNQGNELPGAGLGPGDFVFASEMLRAAPAPASARAGRTGALVIFADRKTAHELMMSVPPLIEVLSA